MLRHDATRSDAGRGANQPPVVAVAGDGWVASVPVEQIPEAIGDLERLRVRLLARLVAAQGVPSGGEDGRGYEQLLTMKEVSRRLGVPQAYARELGRRGELTVVRVGVKYVRVRESVLDAWIRQREDQLHPQE
jgi:excisionase family DNA binding protein